MSVINKLESGWTMLHSNPFQYFSMFLSHSKRLLHRSTNAPRSEATSMAEREAPAVCYVTVLIPLGTDILCPSC